MDYKKLSYLLFISIFVLLTGCKKSDYQYSTIEHFAGFPATETLLKVGDSELKGGDVLSCISLLKKLALHKANGKVSEKRDLMIAKNVRANIFDQFEREELAHSLFVTSGVKVAKEVYEQKENEFLRGFVSSPKEIPLVRGKLEPGEARYLKTTIARQVELDAFINVNCSNEINVTDAWIASEQKRVKEWNAIIDATNAFAHVMASNIVKWVAEGQDFGKLADKYSQDPEKKPGGLVDDHSGALFSNGRTCYLDMLDQMPAGKVSDILPSIEGLLIVKALGKDPKSGMPLYQRIVFQTGVKLPEMSAAELRKMGESQFREFITERLLEAARKTVKIEYPHGKDLLK